MLTHEEVEAAVRAGVALHWERLGHSVADDVIAQIERALAAGVRLDPQIASIDDAVRSFGEASFDAGAASTYGRAEERERYRQRAKDARAALVAAVNAALAALREAAARPR